MFSTLEIFLGMTAGSLATLRPLLRKVSFLSGVLPSISSQPATTGSSGGPKNWTSTRRQTNLHSGHNNVDSGAWGDVQGVSFFRSSSRVDLSNDLKSPQSIGTEIDLEEYGAGSQNWEHNSVERVLIYSR
jgi:hypothetical protein